MKGKIVFLLATILFYYSGNSQILTNTYSAIGDAQVNSGATTTNYGSVDTTQVFFKQSPIGNSIYRTFIQFDLSNIPSEAIIISAKLKLYPKTINNSINHPIYIERVDTTWNASTVTWANAPAAISSDKVSITHSNTTNTTVHEFSVKAHVEYMTNYSYLNNGWRIRLQTESGASSFGINYYSSDYSNSAKHPQLVVEYILPIELSTQVTHCTAGNTDGSLSVDLTGGTQMQTSYISIHKVVRSTTAIGDATLTNVTSGSSVSYNSTTKKITASNLAPGVYRLLVHDSLYYAASDIKFRFYKYFLVGREGETISGILYPSESYQEDVRLAYDKPTASSPTDLANTNQSGFTNLYVTDLENNYEYASLIQYQLDFDPKLEFTKAEIQIKAANKFYHGTTSTNELNYSLVTSPWEEKVVTWNSRPTIDSAFFVYLPETLIVGYDSLDLWDTVSVIPFVEFWQQNPDENFGFEMALLDYNQTQYASRNYKGANSNENFICFEFTVKPDFETIFIDSIDVGSIIVNAPAGELPYTYLIGYDSIPELIDIWNNIKDSTDLDSTSFFQGDSSNRNYTFENLPSNRYFVAAYDNNGDQILMKEVILTPTIELFDSTDISFDNDTLEVKSGQSDAEATLLAALNPNEDGGIEFKIVQLTEIVRFGFNDVADAFPVSTREYNYSVEIKTSGKVYLSRSDTLVDSTDVIVGDRLTLTREQGVVNLYKNNVLVGSDLVGEWNNKEWKVEVELKGTSGKIKPVILYGKLKIPKPVVSIIYPECGELLSTVTITIPPPIVSYFGMTYSEFFLKEQDGTIVYSGSTFPPLQLEVGIYNLSYQCTISGLSYSIYFDEVVVGYPIIWTPDPLTGNITEVAFYLNKIVPTSLGLPGNTKSYNECENVASTFNWVQFESMGYVAISKPLIYSKPSPFSPSWAFEEIILKYADGTVYAKVRIEEIWTGLISRQVSLFNGSIPEGGYISNSLKPFRLEFPTDGSANFDYVELYQDGLLKEDFQTNTSGIITVFAKEFGQVLIQNAIASFCFNSENRVFVTPKRNPEGGYYLVQPDNVLRFEFLEEYAQDGDLNFVVKNFQGVAQTGLSLLSEEFGDNRLSLNVAPLNPGFYQLEITNDKNEIWYLRFKVQ